MRRLVKLAEDLVPETLADDAQSYLSMYSLDELWAYRGALQVYLEDCWSLYRSVVDRWTSIDGDKPSTLAELLLRVGAGTSSELLSKADACGVAREAQNERWLAYRSALAKLAERNPFLRNSLSSLPEEYQLKLPP